MEFQECQRLLSNYCRTGEGAVEQIPGIRSRPRVEMYRTLTSSVVRSALLRAYPITCALLGKSRWQELVEELFAEYPLASPELWRMPRALLEYVSLRSSSCSSDLCNQYPYLLELLEFEWEEIEIYMAPDPAGIDLSPFTSGEQMIYPNPVHRLIEFRYPVFRQPIEELRDIQRMLELEGRYFLLFYRHPEELTVQFVQLSEPFALIWQGVVTELSSQRGCEQSQYRSPRSLFEVATDQLQLELNPETKEVLTETFQQLHESGAVLGRFSEP